MPVARLRSSGRSSASTASQPGGQFGAAPLGHDLGEGPDVLVEALEVRASGGGVLHDQRVVLAQVVGVGEQRLADRAGLGDGRGGGGRPAPARVGVTGAGSGQPEGPQVAADGLGVLL